MRATAQQASPAAAHEPSRVATGDGSVDGSGTVVGRVCAWCRGLIPAGARRDAQTCSQSCRQARHRFNRDVGRSVAVAGGHARRLAYADPPYPGKARLYADHPDYAGEVDHLELIRRLCRYDGWALSTSAAALPVVLALCPPGTRVAAWHRGERPTRSRWPLNAWEPVLYAGGRQDPSRVDGRRVDSLVHTSRPRITDPRRVLGTKPAVFASWMFALLGAQPEDTLEDLFPGSGGITRAWAAYTASQPALAPSPRRRGAARRGEGEQDQ